MNQRKASRICAFLLAVLTAFALLCGCAAAQTFSDMTTTVTEEQPTPQTEPATEAVTVPQTEAPDVTQPVMEAIEDPQAIEAVTEEAIPTNRIAVPRLSGQPRETAEALLQEAGVPYTVVEVESVQYAKGIVTKLQFYGILDEEYCYINPDYPTELLVSIGRRWKTNVSAVDAKRIYLTFDDGPHKNTDHILEILDTYGVKATFFTLGTYVAVYPERTKAIADGGHLLACHSYSHDYMKLYESADAVLNEISAWEAAVIKAGVPVPEQVYFRFPGGTTTTYMQQDRYEEIFWAITDAGYYAMDWTCANNDRYLNGKTEEQSLEEFLLQSVITTVDSIVYSPTLPKIMLMHDTADETVATLAQIIEYLLGEGYTFGTLDELDGYWVFQ